MAFDSEMPTTRTVLMTTAAALALYDSATDATAKAIAAEALADAVRAAAAKPKANRKAAAPSHILNAQNLAATLQRVTRLMERKNTIPILNCVLLTARTGRLEIRGTDMDMEYVEILDDVEGDLPNFQMAVPGFDLLAAMKGQKGGVQFKPVQYVVAGGAEDSSLTITVNGAKTRLAASPAGDFPVMSDEAKWETMTLPIATLREPMAFTQKAISTEETRYYLNGLYFHTVVEQGQKLLSFVSTDGHRLLRENVAGLDFPTFQGVIIPRKAIGWLVSNMPADGEVQIDVSAQKVRFTTATGCFLSKVIDGSFPDYMRVIPRADGGHAMQFDDCKALASAMDRIKANGDKHTASARFTLSDGGVTAYQRNLTGGTVEIAVAGSSYQGEDFQCGFNAAYVADMASAGEPMIWTIGTAADPCLVTWPDRPERTGVLMPLRV